jgi:geranylgeranyl diphosphate synthase type I
LDLDQAFDYYLPLIEAELRRFFTETPASLQAFYGMMSYHMGWLDESLSQAQSQSGKRLRPVLCLLACRAAGGNERDALPPAAALELIHNFSLVHDDIQDNSQIRRHRQTVWTIWGRAHAINVGDGLFAMAFLSLSGLGGSISTADRQAIYEAFARACLLLCEGQYMDMSFETRLEVPQEEYLDMIDRKTAALLSCACHSGALVAGADPDAVERYRLFGQQLGLAFQVQDDVLGIWGNSAVTGKPSADDILQCKKTLPVLYALKREAELGGHTLADLYAQGSTSESDVPAVLDELDRLKALDYARGINESYCDKALEYLEATDGEAATRHTLAQLVERLRERPS